MSGLGDDELGLILSWISDPNDRKSCSQVCKQWLREEGLTRSSIRLLEPESFPIILPRFPNLIKFESSKPLTNDDLKFIAQICPKVEVFNLNFKQQRRISIYADEPFDSQDIGDDGLLALASGRRRLSEVSLRRRKNIGNPGVISLAYSAKNLRHLDLGWCNSITDESLQAIGSASSISVLNLQGCSLITDRGLAYLALGSSSKSLKRLKLAECNRITDSGVYLLHKVSSLEELNLAECGRQVTDTGCLAIAAIETLKKLNLSWLMNVSDTTVVALAEHGQNLVAVDFTGCRLITRTGIHAFANHGSLEGLVLPFNYNICGEDLEYTVVGCKSLRYIVLAKGHGMWIPMAMQENITRSCELRWR